MDAAKKKKIIFGAIVAVLILTVIVVYIESPCTLIGHEVVKHEKVEATCTEDGCEAYEDCKRCDYTTYTEDCVIPATGHDWEKVKVIKKPTCGDEGKKKLKCKICGETKTAKIEATGKHKYGSWHVTEQPTYTEEGEKKRVCSVCGDADYESIEKKDITGSLDYKICYYILKRYEYYDDQCGGYSGDTFTEIIMQEAADNFGVSYDRAMSAWENGDANSAATADYY